MRQRDLKTTLLFLQEDWTHYITLTIPQKGYKDVSAGDCYMGLIDYASFITTADPALNGLFYICKHDEDGLYHLHGLVKSSIISQRKLEKSWRYPVKHVVKFNPDKRLGLYNYLMGQRVGEGIIIPDTFKEEHI